MQSQCHNACICWASHECIVAALEDNAQVITFSVDIWMERLTCMLFLSAKGVLTFVTHQRLWHSERLWRLVLFLCNEVSNEGIFHPLEEE